jgi:hypothetical protein
MGAFGSFTLTNKGRTLQSKAQAGSKLNYTRIAVGSGQLGGQSILLLNGLIDQKKSLPVTRLRMQPPNKAIIGTVLSNQDVTTGFYFREIGVFAQDPDEGEILYCYTNAGTDAEYIPAVGGSNVIEKTIDCIVVIGTASNVSATIDDSLVFTRESEFNAKFDASGGHKHTGAAGDGPKLTSASYAGGSVTDAAMGTRTADPTTATAYGLVGSITQWFSWITKYFKAITGKANPFDAPDITLAATKTHVDNTVVHLTAAERSAWNAAETNAKNASIPKTEKGVAGGVASLDATKLMLSDGAILNGRVVERVFNFSFANGVANQKIDVIFPVNGGIYEIEIIGSFNTVNTAGKLVKRFNGTYSNPASYPTGSQYTEVTGVLKNHISIGEPFFDSDLKWRVTLESRTTAPNPFTVIARVASGGGMGAAPTLSAVYTGTATTLPVAVQAIPDDTVTQSGYLLQKHKLTENDGKVIRLAPNTDLNTVNRNGQYDGYPLVNAPGGNTGAWFFIEVFSHSQNPDTIFFQRATTFSTVPRSYIRECYNSVWGEWTEEENASRKNVANGYAGLDSSAKLIDALVPLNVARKATEITISGTDLNTLGEGEYLCPSNALALTFLNMPPTKTAFHLKVSKHAGFNQTFTTFNTVATGGDRLRIFSRNIYNGVFGAWVEIESTNVKGVADGYAGLDSSVKVPRVNTYSSLGGASVTQITNLDTMLTAGVYPTIQNPTGAPENFFGMLRVTVDSGEAGNGGNWVLQEWMGQAGGNRYTRLKINALAWTAWVKQWDSFNDAPLFTTRGTVSNNTDYNTLVKNGVYMIYNPTGTTNASPAAYGTLTVSTTDPSNVNNSYIKQEVAEAATGIVYTRSKYSPTSWTPWISNVTSAGGTMTAALARNYNESALYKYQNLAGYASTGALTGTIKITMPKTWSNTMMRIKINGYDYNAAKGGWELILGGYNYKDGTPVWISTTALLVGIAPFTSVRFAHDGTNNCILLGTPTTSWNIGNIEVSEFLASFTAISGWEKGWGISLINSETGITNIVTPVLNQVGSNASTLGGYSAAQVTQGTLAYAVTSGTAPTLAATFNPAVAALTAGLRVTIKAHAATTGPVTLNVNGLGAKSIKKPNGNNPPLALGGVYTVVYDGTAFILQGEGGEYGTATAAEVLAGKTIGTENGLVTGTLPNRTRAAAGGYTTAVSAKGDWFGSMVMEPPTGYYESGLNDGQFGTLLAVDPNFVPSSILSTRSIFGVQGSVPVITTGDDPAQGVGKWGDGSLAVYPREGYRKGGSGAGEIKVTTAQLRSVEGDLAPANIRSGVEVFGVTGTLVERMYAEGYTGAHYSNGAYQISGLSFKPRIVRFTFFKENSQSTFVFLGTDTERWNFVEYAGTNPYGTAISSGETPSPSSWGNGFSAFLNFSGISVNIIWNAWR